MPIWEEIEKTHFIGLSIGGMTSLGLALKHQKRFNKLICCAARADMPPPLKEMWDQRIEVVKDKGTNGVVNGSIERWYSEDFNKNSKNASIINLSKNINDIEGTQKTFNHRAKMCTLAAQGKWVRELESK